MDSWTVFSHIGSMRELGCSPQHAEVFAWNNSFQMELCPACFAKIVLIYLAVWLFMPLQEKCDGDELVLQLDDGFQRLLAHGDSPALRLWKQELHAVLLKPDLSSFVLCRYDCDSPLPRSCYGIFCDS